MGVIGKILGTGNVVEKGLGLIDSFHTSETEAIEAKTKAKTDLLSAYAPFKIAQRYLALMFGFTFIGSFLLVLAMTLFNIMGWATITQGDIEIIKQVMAEFKIGWIMLTIVGFYFGGGAFEGVQEKKAKREQETHTRSRSDYHKGS